MYSFINYLFIYIMESNNFNLTFSPVKVLGAVVVIALVLAAHFLWTSIASLNAQVAEQRTMVEEQKKQYAQQVDEAKKQAEEAAKKEEAQQARVDQMWNFLVQATQSAQK